MTEELVSADTGEVVLLKVNYQQALQLEGEAQPAVGYCIMKRPGKLLVGPSCELHFPRGGLPQRLLRDTGPFHSGYSNGRTPASG